MVACCNAQAGQTDDSDLALAQGQEALNELRDMGWDEAVRTERGWDIVSIDVFDSSNRIVLFDNSNRVDFVAKFFDVSNRIVFV